MSQKRTVDGACPPVAGSVGLPGERVEFGRRRLLTGFIAAGVGAGLATIAVPSTRRAWAVPPLPSGASAFTAVAPTRLADTRPAAGIGGFTRMDATTIRVQVAGRAGVPANAAAAVLNVTVTATSGEGYASVYPAGAARPNASNVNFESAGATVPNMVTVKLGSTGAVDVFTSVGAEVIVDVSGAYAPVAAPVPAGRFVAATPAARRVLDTRATGAIVDGGSTRRVQVGTEVPPTASAVVVNLTVTGSTGPGYWTAFPAGTTVPNASNLNIAAAGVTGAGQAIVKLAPGVGAFDVFAEAGGGGHLIVDVAGFFTGPLDPADSDGLFVPLAPYRALDTRAVGSYGRTHAGWVVEFPLPPGAAAAAVAVNLTTTNARGDGYFTAYPARTERPNASNLNTTHLGQTVANHAIVRTSTAGVSVYAFTGGHVLADVAGYYLGAPSPATQAAVLNTLPGPPALPYRITAPTAAIDTGILEGISDAIVDTGNVGHWPGTGLASEDSHMVVFGHRTSAGGPFYSLHLLVPGDVISLTGSDGRQFRYRVTRTDITSGEAADILGAAYATPGATVSLVACSKANGLPTSLDYRIIVTAQLES